MAAGTAPVSFASSARATGIKAIWGPGVVNGVSQFPIYRELGAGIVEETVHWDEVATRRPANPTSPVDPAYAWPTELDHTVAQALAYHMQIAVEIIGAPPWANGGHPWNFAPTNPADYAAFATAAARRYPSVHMWMVWGEPTRTPNFMPETPVKAGTTKLTASQKVAPHRYARILDAAYGALKGISRFNLVIGGMTFTVGDVYPLPWIENLRLPNGRPPRMDLYGHNPFSPRAPNLSNPPSAHGAVDFSDLRRLRNWIDRYLPQPGGRHLRMFLSEWTIPTGPDQEFGFSVDANVQATWITDGLKIMRHWSRIAVVGWIHLRDQPPLTSGGLLTADGQPKPGFAAFAKG